MAHRTEVTIDVIVHATEDATKFLDVFEEMLDLSPKNFSIQKVTGHFDNPITILNAKIIKKEAQNFIKNFVSKISNDQRNQIMENIQERVENSTLHLRIDKQKLVQGEISLHDKNAIKVKIFTPIYNKKEMEKTYAELLQVSN